MRRARHRRLGRLRDAAARRREPQMERRGAEALEIDPAWLPEAAREPDALGHHTNRHAGRRRRGRPGRRRARRRRRPARDRCRWRSGHSGVVFAALDEFAADPQARVHAFCHAVPGAWHAMGVMLSAAGSLAWLRNATDPDADIRRTPERSRKLAARHRGPDLPALPRRRADAARRPGRARRVRRPDPPPRPRRFDARRPRGRRFRPARFTRPRP